MNQTLIAFLMVVAMTTLPALASETEMSTTDQEWLPSLIIDTPAEGFNLAVRLARRGVTCGTVADSTACFPFSAR